jgi:hypothetical protein
MITEGYNNIQRQANILRQFFPIFMFRTVLAASLLAMVVISPASGQIPPSQKITPWCIGVELLNGMLEFIGMNKKIDVSEELKEAGISRYSTDDILFSAFTQQHADKDFYLIFNKAIIKIGLNFENGMCITAVCKILDGSTFSPHDGAAHIMQEGTLVTSTQTSVMIYEFGKSEPSERTYEGFGLPNMTAPRLSDGDTLNVFPLRDTSLKTSDGEAIVVEMNIKDLTRFTYRFDDVIP